MKKLLIAEPTAVFSEALTKALSDTYEVYCCTTGMETLQLLETLRPQALIINLALPYMDGLHVLQEAAYKPPVILALTNLPTAYTLQKLKDATVDFVVTLPCTLQCVVYHIQELTRMAERPERQMDPQSIVEMHLRRLGLPAHRAGFAQLRVGVPLFAQDENQLLKKELYTVIATLCGNDNPEQVERTIREVIKESWLYRDSAVWEEYFPGRKEAPSNKVFIAVMAQKLRQAT